MSDAPGMVSDDRRSPFCYQTHDALDAIRAAYDGSGCGYGKLSTALAVYLCLTEAANREGGESARNGFTAARKQLGAAVGISVDAFDKYVAVLVEIGLVAAARERIGMVNLPNRWRLLDAPRSRVESATGSRVQSAVELELERSSKKKGLEVHISELAVAAPPPRPSNRPASVARKGVTDNEYLLATDVLADFNAAAGTRYSGVEWVSKIISRIREHPGVPREGHAAVIDRVLSGKHWWDGDASPSVIYGNGAVFERALHVAARPLDPNRPMTAEQLREHFAERPNSNGDTIDGEAFEVLDG